MQTLEPEAGGIDAAWVARARALVPAIAAAGPQIDRERQLPAELVAALQGADLYRMLLPRSCGGGEVDPLTFIAAIEVIAAADASTAWCVGQSSGCSMSAAYLAPEVVREIFGPPDGVLAWGPAAGGPVRADVVDGGYRVSGTWQFASGSRHATWLGATTPVYGRDGGPVLDAKGKPELRQVLFPRAAATITDIWDVVGLRGTGSDRYAVSDLFVPAAYSYIRDVTTRREPGPLYHLSIINLFACGFAGIGLGIARAALDAFYELAGAKRPSRSGGGGTLRESTAIQAQAGLAEARLRAARAFLFASTRAAWEHATRVGPPTLDQRMEMRMASTFAIQTAKDVVDVVYTAAGTNAIFAGGPFERRFRDVHAVTQQVQGHLANFETVGKYLMGLPAELNI